MEDWHEAPHGKPFVMAWLCCYSKRRLAVHTTQPTYSAPSRHLARHHFVSSHYFLPSLAQAATTPQRRQRRFGPHLQAFPAYTGPSPKAQPRSRTHARTHAHPQFGSVQRAHSACHVMRAWTTSHVGRCSSVRCGAVQCSVEAGLLGNGHVLWDARQTERDCIGGLVWLARRQTGVETMNDNE